MRKLTVAIILSCALFPCCQRHAEKVVPTEPTSQGSRLDEGVVDGNTYKNPSVGLELTPASELELQAPELKGTDVTVFASGEYKFRSDRNTMFVGIEGLAGIPESRRSTEGEMLSWVKVAREDGSKPIEENLESKLGGVAFLRRDLVKSNIQESILVKACRDYALIFIFAGPDREALNGIIQTTQLKLDMARTGCGADTIGAKKSDGRAQR
jgi:hypothetical protein